MKTVNANSVLGVMNLFNSEEYYMQTISALWTLRAIISKDIERTDSRGWLYYDKSSPHYQIWKTLNDIIGRSWVLGYSFYFIETTPHWDVYERRTSKNSFLSHEEAERVSRILGDKETVEGLYSLKKLTGFSANDLNNPVHIIYQFTSGLLNIVNDSKSLSA